MNETINNYMAQMNEKFDSYVKNNFESINQNTQELLKELIMFREVSNLLLTIIYKMILTFINRCINRN